VPVAPLLQALVDVDQPLGDLRRALVVAVDGEQHLLDLGRGLERLGDVAAERVGRHGVALGRQVAEVRVEDRGPALRRGDPLPGRAAGRVLRQHPGVAPAQHGLQLPELGRLEAARRRQPPPEPEELAGRHGLQHVDLRHSDLQDREDPLQGVEHVRGVAGGEPVLQPGQLVEELLEPQLVDLVDDDEQQLVVLVGPWSLRPEHLVQRQVRAVGHGGGVVRLGRLAGLGLGRHPPTMPRRTAAVTSGSRAAHGSRVQPAQSMTCSRSSR
jgi:hypothetical protein